MIQILNLFQMLISGLEKLIMARKNMKMLFFLIEEFLKRYPKHDKAPGALLKEGMAFLELKDKKPQK